MTDRIYFVLCYDQNHKQMYYVLLCLFATISVAVKNVPDRIALIKINDFFNCYSLNTFHADNKKNTTKNRAAMIQLKLQDMKIVQGRIAKNPSNQLKAGGVGADRERNQNKMKIFSFLLWNVPSLIK